MAAVELIGFASIPPDHLNALKERLPLKVTTPRDRQLVITSHEMAIN